MSIERSAENDALMEAVLIHRGMFLTCFSQVEWFLAKILVEANGYPEYSELDLSFSIKVERRIKLVRQLLAAEGPFHKFQERLCLILDRIEEFIEFRNFMAHSVLISDPHPIYGIIFRMRMFRAFKGGNQMEGSIDFNAGQLRQKTNDLSGVTREFIAIIREISQEYDLDLSFGTRSQGAR